MLNLWRMKRNAQRKEAERFRSGSLRELLSRGSSKRRGGGEGGAEKKARKKGFREETKKAWNHEGGFPKQSSRRTLWVWRALLLSADVVWTKAAFAPQVWRRSRSKGGGGGGGFDIPTSFCLLIFSCSSLSVRNERKTEGNFCFGYKFVACSFSIQNTHTSIDAHKTGKHTHAHIDALTHAHAWMHTNACMYTNTHKRMHAHPNKHTHTWAHICMRANENTHKHTYTHTHTLKHKNWIG